MLQRYRRQQRARFLHLGTRLLLFTLLEINAVWMLWHEQIVAGLFLAVVGGTMLLAQRVQNWITRWSFRKSPYRDEHLTIELTDEGYRAHSPKQDVRLNWSVFTK